MLTLLQARKANNLTLMKLSEISGVAIANLSLVENYHSKPHKTTIKQVEAILGQIDWEQRFIKNSSKNDVDMILSKLIAGILGLPQVDQKSCIDKAIEQLNSLL